MICLDLLRDFELHWCGVTRLNLSSVITALESIDKSFLRITLFTHQTMKRNVQPIPKINAKINTNLF